MSCGLGVLDSSSAAVPVKESVSCVLENPELTRRGPKPPRAQVSPWLLLLILEMLCFALCAKRARVLVELQ